MKAKSLQFGKAMSAALFVLLLVVVGTKKALAQTQVATLQHGNDISVYYGQNAFVEAHTAAETGDIITLSSGTFTSTSITKAITLRGAGCTVDTVNNVNPTYFPSLNLSKPEISTSLTIEGIHIGQMNYGDTYNPIFIKCYIDVMRANTYSGGGAGHLYNTQFKNCIIQNITNTYYTTNFSYNTTVFNSVIWNSVGLQAGAFSQVYNSIIGNCKYSSGSGNNITAYNSIIINDQSNSQTSSSYDSFYNCIGIQLGTNSPFGANSIKTGCVIYTSYEDVFETFTGNFSFNESFNLKDDVANNFLGYDGTEVSIHGGLFPFNTHPSYMIIKRCNVASQSTIDGKLSVDIEIISEGD